MRYIIAALLATVLLSGCYYVRDMHILIEMRDGSTMSVDGNTVGGPKDYKPAVDIPVSVVPK